MMMNQIEAIKSQFQAYCANVFGAIAIAFAVMAPVVIGAAGMSLDYAQAYLVQQRLAQAIDAAALAGAASSNDQADIERRVKEFFDANYPPEKLGATFEPQVSVDGDVITVSGSARYNTLFLPIIGIDEIDVDARTVVQREVQGLEVVMVLDNTGSMAINNNIGALRDASESFINILFDRTSNPNLIRIGMVPYSNSVRVGPYGLGETPDGDAYGDPFVTLPPDMSYTTNRFSSNWYGCVVEHNENNFHENATYVPNSRGQLWQDPNGNFDGHGWDPRINSNDPYNYDVLDRDFDGLWDVYAFGRVIGRNDRCSNYNAFSNNRCSSCNGPNNRCNRDFCFCYVSNNNHGTNRGCPYALVKPMTSDRDDLIDHLDTMIPDGNTLGNIGMAWGARLISPQAPFEEGRPFNDPFWRKAVVMMTDGDNTLNGLYSSYWFRNRNTAEINVNQLNERFEETCQALKDQGVTIYTVTFTSNINDTTRGFYERCASNPAQYFDAPTQDDLIETFERISRELSNLHIRG